MVNGTSQLLHCERELYIKASVLTTDIVSYSALPLRMFEVVKFKVLNLMGVWVEFNLRLCSHLMSEVVLARTESSPKISVPRLS